MNKQDNEKQVRPMGGGLNIRMKDQRRAKNFKKAFMQLLRYTKRYKVTILISLFLAALGAVLTIIGPVYIKDITDTIQKGLKATIDVRAINKIAITLSIIYAFSAIFSYSQNAMMATVTQKVSKNLRTDISRKINKVPLKYYDKTSYGDILSRVTNDVDSIGQTLNHSIASLITGITVFIGALIMMFITNWIMAITAISAALIGFATMITITKSSQKYFVGQQSSLGQLNGHIEEVYSNYTIVKVYNGGVDAKNKFKMINDKLYNNGWKSQFFSGLMLPLMGFLGNFGYVAVTVVGGALALSGHISFGVIIAFTIYVRLFTHTLNQFAQALTSLQTSAAASERIFEFLEEAELVEDINKEASIENVVGEVEFENVRFGYEENKTIIHDLSFKALPGQKIAIVGPTGAGKTTLVNLLMKFYEINSGKIYIDGNDINDLSRNNIHDSFSMVLQDTWLFEGTIKENIIYNKANVTGEEVINACKAANIHHFIQTLPNTYDYVISEKSSLSQGQKQLLTIARAMVKDAPMLILDEATSSVDTRSEVLIQEAMDKLMVGRTSFVIAHRLSTIKNADLILVMKDGDIIEQGNHIELLDKGGFYADLYNSQFEGEEGR